MNDQTTKLIESLAAKLGTTTEYLWGVLIKQASVSATIDLIYLIAALVSGVILLRAHMRFANDDSKVSYYEHGDALSVPMVIAAIIWAVVTLIALLFGVPNIINGYLNPEYWALNRVMDLIK